MADENPLFQNYPLTNETVTGDFAAISNLNPLLDLHKRSNLYVIPDLTPVKIDKIVKPDISAQFHVRSHPLEQMLRSAHLVNLPPTRPEFYWRFSTRPAGKVFGGLFVCHY